MSIGIFDSGLGGLTVVKEIFRYLPGYKVIYFGDTARVPYGNKSKETIQRYSLENSQFLIQRGAKIIVVACNTSSALALDYLRRKFRNIPILGVVKPAAQKALGVTSEGKIGIIGTRGTVESKIFLKLLKSPKIKIEVCQEACPLFVPLVEEGWIDCSVTQKIIKSYLEPLKTKKIDTLILACTHYSYLKKQIKKVMGENIHLVDPSYEVVIKLKNFLEKHPRIATEAKSHQFFASDISPHLNQLAQKWLGRKIRFKKAKIF